VSNIIKIKLMLFFSPLSFSFLPGVYFHPQLVQNYFFNR
jgi:hypothetical protein